MSAAALAAGAIALFAWWAVDEGGFAPTTWYPGALALLIALVAAAATRVLRALAGPARWALLALAAFTAWSFLSITWADARGDAWDGANRTLLYLIVFASFAAVAWRPATATGFLAGVVAATVGVGLWALLAAVTGLDVDAVVEGRLAGPVGYENASGALFLAAFWPAVVLAARRATPALGRGPLLAAAGVLLELAVLTQSRAAVLAGGAALALALWLTRERGRLLAALAAVAVVAGAALPLLLAVYAADDGRPHGALVRAAVAIGVSAVVLVVVGWASTRLDERSSLRWPARLAPGGRLALAALVVVALVAGAAFARSTLVAGGGTATRFAPGVDEGRADLWRVAAGQLADRPLHGAGADDFAHAYVRERRERDELLYPHSVVWRTLGQLGLVGGALLGAFLAAMLVVGRRLARDPIRGPIAAGALVAAGYWLAHATFDWLWELPAVTAPAMACLGLVAGLGGRAPADVAGGDVSGRVAGGAASGHPSPTACGGGAREGIGHGRASGRAVGERRGGGGRSGGAIAAIALGCVAAGAAAVSLALPALAAWRIERAAGAWETDPAAARRDLDAARRLNPLTDRADVVAGALALEAGDRTAARRAFARAVQRDARSWHSQTQLAVLELAAGPRATAVARLERARDLNPLEPAIAAALAAARRSVPVPPAVALRLRDRAIPGPLGPRPVRCRPVLGLAAACTREARR